MGKFESGRFKTQLKLAKHRLELLIKVHQNGCGNRRKEIGSLLQQGHDERARVNVKYMIRDDYLMEAYEMLLSCCEDLIQSVGLISREKNMDSDLEQSAKSLLFACGRIDCPELDRVRSQLEAKYGKSFVDVNSEVGRAAVDPRIVVKLSMRAPDQVLVNKYLATIAEIFGIDWKCSSSEEASPPPLIDDIMSPASPANTSLGEQTSIDPPSYTAAISSLSPPPPSTNSNNQDNPSPSSQQTTTTTTRGPNFEELTRRFKALKD